MTIKSYKTNINYSNQNYVYTDYVLILGTIKSY